MIRAMLLAVAVGTLTGQNYAPKATPPAPSELTSMLNKARIRGTVEAWCRGEFRPGRSGYAAGVASPTLGNHYVAVDSSMRPIDLATFISAPDLSCYSPQEIRTLAQNLRQSGNVAASIVPRWNTTTVCGFVNEATAVCWQFSPAEEVFVEIGKWTN